MLTYQSGGGGYMYITRQEQTNSVRSNKFSPYDKYRCLKRTMVRPIVLNPNFATSPCTSFIFFYTSLLTKRPTGGPTVYSSGLRGIFEISDIDTDKKICKKGFKTKNDLEKRGE